jgi:glycosyltransferase involved in cell wall biosynthesis
MDKKIAIVYDRVNKWGGAESVLLALNKIFPEAPLYTSVYFPSGAAWAKVFPRVVPSYLNKLGFLRDKHEYMATLMPIAFESFNFDDYDLVISVTSEAAKGIIVKPHTRHICYCLTPTRYLWSHYEQYFESAGRLFSRPIVEYLRYWDKIASQRPDAMIGISRTVCERIKSYYGRDSVLIYPPVDTDKFQTAKNSKTNIINNLKLENKNYYLIVSRLVSYKKVDLAIEAFNELKYPLVIVGSGGYGDKLKRMAGKNIIFTGFMENGELIEIYKSAKAFIFPQEEDFGITAVEAQAAGLPVIAYKGGGALETVIEGKTGVFFDKQDAKSLISAIRRFEKKHFNKEMIIANARRFSSERFEKSFLEYVKELL